MLIQEDAMHSETSKPGRRQALVLLGAGIAAAGAMPAALAQDQGSLIDATEAFRRAMVDGNEAALLNVLHDDLTYSHSDGRVWTKQDLLANVVGKNRYLSIETSQQTVAIAGQTGIVRHTFDVVNNLGNGKTAKNHIKVLLCWVYSDQAHSWRLLARSSTTLPA